MHRYCQPGADTGLQSGLSRIGLFRSVSADVAEDVFSTAAPHWETVLHRLEGAYSPNTIRGYRSDFRAFAEWCLGSNERNLPARFEIVAAYVAEVAPKLRVNTLRRRIVTIRRMHQLAGLPDPTLHLDVFLAFRRAWRSQLARPRQAMGLTAAYKEQLLETCREDLQGLRDQALISLGYEALCRRSELVTLQAEDMRPNLAGGQSMLVRRGKSDAAGNGRMVALSRRSTEMMLAWLGAAGITSGPAFRPVYHDRVLPRSLHPLSVTRILKRRAKQAGLREEQIRNISSHSLRVGAAQQLTINGYGLLQIMRAGGWRSTTSLFRYIEHAEVSLWD